MEIHAYPDIAAKRAGCFESYLVRRLVAHWCLLVTFSGQPKKWVAGVLDLATWEINGFDLEMGLLQSSAVGL